MSPELIAATLAGIAFFFMVGGVALWKIPKRLKNNFFTARWKELQSLLRDKTTWSNALIEADSLLDIALKKRKFKGKSMGERMVSAQRLLTNNDAHR